MGLAGLAAAAAASVTGPPSDTAAAVGALGRISWAASSDVLKGCSSTIGASSGGGEPFSASVNADSGSGCATGSGPRLHKWHTDYTPSLTLPYDLLTFVHMLRGMTS